MRLGRVPDGDSLFRHCVHPISFNKQTGFVPEKMWHLVLQNGTLHGSLAWERYVPTVKDVHGYGCRLASAINEAKRKKGKFKEKDRHYYCGAYRLWGRSLRALPTTAGLWEIASADVVHLIEAGEIAHADVRVFLKPGNYDVEGTKTAIVDRLWYACTGPLKHICNCDRDILDHHSSNLPTGPLGEYSDSRPKLLRQWYILRFRILNWLWRNSTPPSVASPDARSGFRRWRSMIKFQICSRLWRCFYRA